MKFLLFDMPDAALVRMRRRAEFELQEGSAADQYHRDLAEKIDRIQQAREALADVYGAREGGTDVPFVAWRMGAPPSYRLALARDQVRGWRGKSSALAWSAWGLAAAGTGGTR